MTTGYSRVDILNNIDKNKPVSVLDLDRELDGLVEAFDETDGHNHDGTSGQGDAIEYLGPAQEYRATAASFSPETDDAEDLGTESLRFKDSYARTFNPVGLTVERLTFGSDGTVSFDYEGTVNRTLTFPDSTGEVVVTDGTGSELITGKTIGGTFYPETIEQFYNAASGIEMDQDKVGYQAGYRGIPQQFTFSGAYSVGYGTDFMALLDSGASVILRESTWFDGLSGIASQQQPQEGDIKVFRNIHTSNISFTCDVENCYIDGSGDNVASFELEPQWLCTAVWLATDTVVILGTDGISSIVNK